MADTGAQEKSEKPTQKKLKEGREKGNVAKSIELNSAAVLVSGFFIISFTQSYISENIMKFSAETFSSMGILSLRADNIQKYLMEWGLVFFLIFLPVAGGILLAGLTVNIAQVGLKFSGKTLMPDFSKQNPVKNIKRIFFSTRSIMEVAKTVVKFLLISVVAYYSLNDFITESPLLMSLSVEEILSFMIDSSFSFVWKITAIFIIIAGTDFIFQKFKFNKEMMMSKQEIKEENKESEGDPLVKSRIRKLQFAAAGKRMMKDVATADVVITNPTHYAIAIKYDMLKDNAPKIVAKGMDELAQKIKKTAAEANVPLHENKELARALYKSCKVGDQIPQELFKAVAQILAYIFNLRSNKKKKQIV